MGVHPLGPDLTRMDRTDRVARGPDLSQKFEVRGWAILLALLSAGLGAPSARGLPAIQYGDVAPLAPNPYRGLMPVPAAQEPAALQRRTLGARRRLALAPSPYELASPPELAPNPYGAIAPLAPDPYLEQDVAHHAPPLTSMLHEPSALRGPANSPSQRLALLPSPYELAPALDLAPNPY
jgi:hypothetical protein